MAWIYLAESEGFQSPLKNGLDQSHIVKSIPIVKVSCFQTWPNQFYRMHQSGMTYEPLEGNGFLASFPRKSFMGAFHVKISVLQGMEKAWKESEADLFLRCCIWPKKLSPRFYFLKMSPPLLPEEELESLKNLPKWGMILDGVLFPLHPLEHLIGEKDSSYWATPNTMDHLPLRSKKALIHQFTHARKGRTKPANLREQIHPECWPVNLMKESTKMPTGKLNPVFVEWLMNYPLGWTELDPWAMQWLQFKRKKPSKH